MNSFTTSERLLTWLDVEKTLKQSTSLWSKLPESISSIDCFSDGMEITYHDAITSVYDWLQTIFGKAYNPASQVISLRIANATYPVTFIEDFSSAPSTSLPTYPLWRDITYIEANKNNDSTVTSTMGNLPNQWTDGPQMVSFHSFKGGVGRTTALMTYVAACLQQPNSKNKKILVIDADIEAPGVSFWLDEINTPKVSFIQLLEALHYPHQTPIRALITLLTS